MRNCKECYYNIHGCELYKDAEKCESYLDENCTTIAVERIPEAQVNSERLLDWISLEHLFSYAELESYARVCAVRSMMAKKITMAHYFTEVADNYSTKQLSNDEKVHAS